MQFSTPVTQLPTVINKGQEHALLYQWVFVHQSYSLDFLRNEQRHKSHGSNRFRNHWQLGSNTIKTQHFLLEQWQNWTLRSHSCIWLHLLWNIAWDSSVASFGWPQVVVRSVQVRWIHSFLHKRPLHAIFVDNSPKCCFECVKVLTLWNLLEKYCQKKF